MSLVKIKNMTVKLEGHVALTNVSMQISQGEIVTIVGPNGSGKSTLLRTIVGAIQPTSGIVNITDSCKIGYVPQKLHIDATLPITVKRFLCLPKAQNSKNIKSILKRVGSPDIENRQMANLSGGQFQRVLLARAILNEPDLLILDEATQGLDQMGAASFYRLVENLRSTLGCAILMVSHELHVVMSASDRVICLNGHVCCHGTPDIVASDPEYHALFGSGTQGALALYRHEHNHTHNHDGTCDHDRQYEDA
ncbi:metal ABC transporter ATP-binding protein [Amylibacter sp. SFDW26]|uniref:ATP-binding cassette domain-containing protein n=1 Tax=Amylibacter sp. SFDW26 TaxID=2652722 RepID=UPI001262883D|nr:metal ABC transporter ATP-binding protein [Amylibacter sp. SFDW26]KAB7610104.1 metal ABC transporter ATP-binding protein [Amylibacter sp. SFDW26]